MDQLSFIQNLLCNIQNQSVLVVGDLMLDHYIWGDTHRISPEAPVPVVDVRQDTYRAGGAANVALNISALTAQAHLCGVIGQDEPGACLKQILGQQGIVFEDDWVNPHVPTIVKTRVMVRHQQLCRLDREASPQAYSWDHLPTVRQNLEAALDRKKALILSDYAKGALQSPIADFLIAKAQSQGILVSYDPKPRADFHVQGVDLMTPNKVEALQLAAHKPSPTQAFPAEAVCQAIWEKYQPRFLVITLGADGMLLSEKGKVIQQIPTYAREVADVSGAGDTVIAALTLALAAGASLEQAACFANMAAGVVVAKVGTAVATPAEIIHFMQHLA